VSPSHNRPPRSTAGHYETAFCAIFARIHAAANTKDYWPALAESVGWGYGSVGSTGFNRPPVSSRWHKGFTHSRFLTDRFCREQWLPFLKNGEIKRGDPPQDLPLAMRLLTALPLRWIAPAMLAAAIVFAAIMMQLPFRPNGPPKPLVPDHFDTLVTTPEKVKLTRFTFIPNRDSPLPRRWEKREVAGIEYWAGLFDDGRSPLRFDTLRRIRTDDGCVGTVVAMQGLATNQLFLPDREDECQNHELLSRETNFGRWQDLGQVDSGK
jgi:hypothetical protein